MTSSASILLLSLGVSPGLLVTADPHRYAINPKRCVNLDFLED